MHSRYALSQTYGGEYWTKMLLDRTIRYIISNLPVYCLPYPVCCYVVLGDVVL